MRNYEHTANAMIDFIYASEEFVKAIKLGVSGKKFLTGYSEGGYIAMATLKMIEERPASGISIDATAVGGGGYNLVNILKNEIINTTYDFPSDIAMLLYSYNSMYDWNRPLLDFFNEPYASRIPVLFNGEYNRQEINQQLTNSLDIFLNNDFLNNLRSDSDDELVLITALSNNSVDNWTPKSLLSIIHGRNDEIIPFSDSEETYNKMVANGSTSVTFTPIETGGHVDSGIEFIEIAVLWFNSLNP
jgi:pimeloyl-ACP methyl ester carboxylesterase